MIGANPMAFESLLGSISEAVVDILPFVGTEAAAVAEVMKQYRSLRPQFADAMLVYLANRESIRTIFTLDQRDFSVYRTRAGKPLQLIAQ